MPKKTGEFIANFTNEMKRGIESHCPGLKVVSLTTDNARNMKSAWRILEGQHAGFFCTGCGAHTLNLLVKDFMELSFVGDVVRDAHTLALFIRSHTNTSERLRTDQAEHPSNSQRELGISVATRWYSNRSCIQNILDNEDAIRRIMGDARLLKSYSKTKVAEAKAIVDSNTFWIQGGLVLQLLDPVTECIAHFEKDTCSLSVVFEQFLRLKNLPIYNDQHPGIPAPVQQHCRRRIRARWRFIHKNSMKLAYLLDHTKSSLIFTQDEIILLIQQLVLIADKLGYTALELDQVQRQLSRFMTRKMEFSSADKAVFYKMPPFEWWSWIVIGDYPLVSLIAQRVFTIPTSSASAERGWSTHGRIHSDIRNSLGNEKAHMLAAIYTNHDDKEWEIPIEFDAVLGDQHLWGGGAGPFRNPNMEVDSQDEAMDDSDEDSETCSNDGSCLDWEEERVEGGDEDFGESGDDSRFAHPAQDAVRDEDAGVLQVRYDVSTDMNEIIFTC